MTAPATCPNCGSQDRADRELVTRYYDDGDWDEGVSCDDEWHDRPTCPTCGGLGHIPAVGTAPTSTE